MTDHSDLIERLESPLVMSMFISKNDLYQKQEQQREEAAAALREQQAEIERLREAATPYLISLIAHGYAPGGYMCFCGECGDSHTADKRAWRCLKCAEARAALGKDGA